MNSDNTQGLSGGKGLCKVGDYMTHPAFISFDVNGLWVGKFETGYKDATNSTDAQVDPSSEADAKIKADNVIIKPDEYSWRNIQPAYSHLISYNYKRDLDSHMMKNTEWGAVAYLSHSIYGTCNKEGCKEVKINNTSDYKTGFTATVIHTAGFTGTNESCSKYPQNCNEHGLSTNNSITAKWNSIDGQKGSTTGNYTGIYDMSGGAWEYVMGVMADINGNPVSSKSSSYNSGFNGSYTSDSTAKTLKVDGINFPDSKYYDLYNNVKDNSQNHYSNRILGDATGEMGPFKALSYKGNAENATTINRNGSSWYLDTPWFVNSNKPWFWRGATYKYGLIAGIFSFGEYYGSKTSEATFRIVLAYKEE